MAKESSSQAGTKTFVPEGRSAMVAEILLGIVGGVIANAICGGAKTLWHFKH